MLNAIIIDDEKHCIDKIQQLLIDCNDISIIDTASDVKSSIDIIKKHKPDLLFLDIELSDGTAFELLEHFHNPEFQVIFTTGHNDYAIKAFRHNAIDYLIKPIEKELLLESIKRALKQKNTSQNAEKLSLMMENLQTKNFSKLVIPQIDGFQLIQKKDILYCESNDNYTMIYLVDNEKILTTKSIKKIDELLFDHNFFRLHRAFIVNIDSVQKILKNEGGQVLLDNGTVIPIARRRKDEFLALIGM